MRPRRSAPEPWAADHLCPWPSRPAGCDLAGALRGQGGCPQWLWDCPACLRWYRSPSGLLGGGLHSPRAWGLPAACPCLWWAPSASELRPADEPGWEKGRGLHGRFCKGLVKGLERAVPGQNGQASEQGETSGAGSAGAPSCAVPFHRHPTRPGWGPGKAKLGPRTRPGTNIEGGHGGCRGPVLLGVRRWPVAQPSYAVRNAKEGSFHSI